MDALGHNVFAAELTAVEVDRIGAGNGDLKGIVEIGKVKTVGVEHPGLEAPFEDARQETADQRPGHFVQIHLAAVVGILNDRHGADLPARAAQTVAERSGIACAAFAHGGDTVTEPPLYEGFDLLVALRLMRHTLHGALHAVVPFVAVERFKIGVHGLLRARQLVLLGIVVHLFQPRVGRQGKESRERQQQQRIDESPEQAPPAISFSGHLSILSLPPKGRL